MQVKQFNKIADPEIWALSETDDVIITKGDSNEQRVLINYKTYQTIKQALANRSKSNTTSMSADSFDLDPFLQDFIDILNNDQFEDITDDDHYFENFVRNIKTGE